MSASHVRAGGAGVRLTDQIRARLEVAVRSWRVILQTTVAAAALGACFIERHITLDRTMWGSDQAASLEPAGLSRLVRDVRVVSEALGDGVKRIYPGEYAAMRKLRRVPGVIADRAARVA